MAGTGAVVAAYVGAWKPGGGVSTVEGIHGGPESGWGVEATHALEQRMQYK